MPKERREDGRLGDLVKGWGIRTEGGETEGNCGGMIAEGARRSQRSAKKRDSSTFFGFWDEQFLPKKVNFSHFFLNRHSLIQQHILVKVVNVCKEE